MIIGVQYSLRVSVLIIKILSCFVCEMTRLLYKKCLSSLKFSEAQFFDDTWLGNALLIHMIKVFLLGI